MNKFLITILFLSFGGCRSAENVANCIDESKINPDAVCVQIYKPVCGCDNKTYGNDCVAQNNGVTTWQDGECESKKQE